MGGAFGSWRSLPAIVASISVRLSRSSSSGGQMLNRNLGLALLSFTISFTSACLSQDPTEDLPVDEQAVTGKADGVVWRKVYDCDGAVLDVNSSERRQLQLVVR